MIFFRDITIRKMMVVSPSFFVLLALEESLVRLEI